MPAETAVGLSLDAHTLLTTLCQLGCEVGHVQVRVRVYTGCIKCIKCRKNVLLLRETAHIVLLMEKMVLREFRRAIA